MTMITKGDVAKIQGDVTKAVEAVLKAHGYKLGKNACRYSDFDLKFTIEALKDDANALAERARMMFKFNFKEYGIDFGTVVTDRSGNRKFSVEGFTRTGKLEARDARDGRIYKGDPKIFFLNGKPLESEMDRRIADMNKKNAERAAAADKAE